MGLIKTGLKVQQTIRNVGRLREMVAVFARHGFSEFISSGVLALIPDFALPRSKKDLESELSDGSKKDWSHIIGQRLRLCFEELGPTFIKFGQLLSSREDLFEAPFIDQMKLLRDQVGGMTFSEMKGHVEIELGRSIEEIFLNVDENPVGTASIGMVFSGALINGEKVVIKVKRPGIDKIINNDLSVLVFLAAQIEKASEELRYLGISRVIHDFSISIQSELNFFSEALNCERLERNIAIHDKEEIFYIPKIYSEYTTRSVLVMEFLQGIAFSQQGKILERKEEVAEKLLKGIGIFLKTFLNDGFYHADLHGGNFFLLDSGKIGLVDFGLMGTLSKKGRQSFIAIIYSIVTYNYENLVYEFLDVAEYESTPDIDVVVSDVRDALSPFIGLTVQQTNFNSVLRSVAKTLRTHKLYLPREWYTVFRTLITLDGVGKSLGMDIDLFSLVEGDIETIAKDSFSKKAILEEGIWAARDFLSLSRIFPRHLKWFLKEWAKNGYAIELKHIGMGKYLKGLAHGLTFLGLMIFSGILVLSGVLVSGERATGHISEIPVIALIFWAGAIICCAKAWTSFRN